MNNLKRVLSTVLAGTMLAGMMVVGASAATFTDQEDIEHTEAVDTMVTLGVINGKDDGSYDPDAIVTRAEMAKMITLMLNGGKEPVLTVKSNPTYSDIDGHWAEKYIEYCSGDNSTKSQIIAGQGDGTFGPDAPVTGSAAAKMALVALGYDASVFHFTGVDWEINVNGIANSPDADLYDGLEGIDPSNGMTRDEAAQLLYNALDALVMNKTYDKVLSNGEISYTYSLSEKTMMESKFGAVKIEGIVVANEAATLTTTELPDSGVIGSALNEGETRIQITNSEDQDTFKNTQTFSVASGEDELGRKVSFYVKPSSTAKKSTVLGSLMVSGDNTVVTSYSNAKASKVLDDNDLEMASDAVYYKNYMGETKITKALLSQAGETGVERIFIDNDDDGEVEIVFVNYSFLGKVTAYSTKDDGSITVKSKGYTVEADVAADVVGFDDVAKNDYVIYTSFGGKLYVSEAETIEGEVKKYTGSDNITSLTVDGTKYDVAHSSTLVSTDLTAVYTADIDDLLDATAEFYLNEQGQIVAYGDVDESAYTYCYVLAKDNGNTIDGGRAKIVCEDGTKKVYTVSSKSDIAVKNIVEDTVYAYSIDKDGELRLKSATAGDTQEIDFTKGKTAVGNDYATGSTVFFYVKGSTVDVYIGYKSAPSVKDTNTTVYTNSDDKVVAVVFTDASGVTTLGDHLFLYSISSKGSDTFDANVFLAGEDEKTTITVNGKASEYEADKAYYYTVDEDGNYDIDEIEAADLKTGIVANVTGETIAVAGGEYYLTDATLTLDNVDTTATPDATLGSTTAEKGDAVTLLVDGDDVLMIIITAYAAEE